MTVFQRHTPDPEPDKNLEINCHADVLLDICAAPDYYRNITTRLGS